jgi:hypothetical protein
MKKLLIPLLSIFVSFAQAQAGGITVLKDAAAISSPDCKVRLLGGPSDDSNASQWDSDTFSNEGSMTYMIDVLKNKNYTFVNAIANHAYNADVNKVNLALSFKYGKMTDHGHQVQLTITDYTNFFTLGESNLLYSIYGDLGNSSDTLKQFADRIPPCVHAN